MSLTISIRFLTGRAHLHPWQTHHSEGRVEWPPSHWRLLRALVAVAGRGLTSLPYSDFVVDPGKKPKPTRNNPSPIWPAADYIALPDNWAGEYEDEIPLSRLAGLLHSLSATPTIWLPKTAGGHTRQYFPIHSGGMVKNSGSAVFDTFATVRKDQPLLFHWGNVELNDQRLADLHMLLGRMTYFGRAESWCRAEAHTCLLEEITGDGISAIKPKVTHWECRCIEDDVKPDGQEYRDYLLERRLAPIQDTRNLLEEAMELFSALKRPKKLEATKELKKHPDLAKHDWSNWQGRIAVCAEKLHANGHWDEDEIKRIAASFANKDEKRLVRDLLTNCMKPQKEFEAWESVFCKSTSEVMLLRCLLRESGQDIKDGLERPIGTRWVHYSVPRSVFDIPRPKPQPRPRKSESVDLVRYVLNTATVHRPVLPALTDTLLVADRFRSAVMSLCREPSRALSGHEPDGTPCRDQQHAFWWPVDEDNDGFIDHVMVWAPGGFEQREVDALRRLTRLRQRGGRPDLLVTPTFIGQHGVYNPWHPNLETGSKVFVSATPYFCPVHLSHGRGKSGRVRSLRSEVIKSLQIQQIITSADEVFDISEIVFDYQPDELVQVASSVRSHQLAEPIPPRQFFPVIPAPDHFPPLPAPVTTIDIRYPGAVLKGTDESYCFGNSIGLTVDNGSRFIRALSFCRRRRGHELRGRGRVLQITFCQPRRPSPFAIGSQCHYGIGLFVPASASPVEGTP